MMNMNMCCILSCKKTRTSGLFLHSFPNPNTDSERFKLWINAVGGDVLELDPQRVFRSRKVCSSHFESHYHLRNKRLSANALPTLQLPDQKVNDTKSNSASNAVLPHSSSLAHCSSVIPELSQEHTPLVEGTPLLTQETPVLVLRSSSDSDTLPKLHSPEYEFVVIEVYSESDVDDQSDIIEPKLENQFEEIEPKSDYVPDQYDGIEPKSDNVPDEYDNIERKSDSVPDQYEDIEPKCNNIPDEYDDIEPKSDNVLDQFDEIEPISKNGSDQFDVKDINSGKVVENVIEIVDDETESTLGKNMDPDIAARWQETLKYGLPEEIRDKLVSQYPIPVNCSYLLAPLLKLKLGAVSRISKQDVMMMHKQNQIGVALAALAQVIDLINSNETSKETLLRPIENACQILCDSHHAETKMRQYQILDLTDDDSRDLLADTTRDKYLFGETPSKKFKVVRSVRKNRAPSLRNVIKNPLLINRNRSRSHRSQKK